MKAGSHIGMYQPFLTYQWYYQGELMVPRWTISFVLCRPGNRAVLISPMLCSWTQLSGRVSLRTFYQSPVFFASRNSKENSTQQSELHCTQHRGPAFNTDSGCLLEGLEVKAGAFR